MSADTNHGKCQRARNRPQLAEADESCYLPLTVIWDQIPFVMLVVNHRPYISLYTAYVYIFYIQSMYMSLYIVYVVNRLTHCRLCVSVENLLENRRRARQAGSCPIMDVFMVAAG